MRRICLSEARRVLGHPEDAEEAVQEALERAWRRKETCRDVDAPIAWIRRITRNESLRVLGHRSRRTEHELAGVVDSAGRADDDLEKALSEITLDQVTAPLTHADRALVRLRYLHDFSQAELAKVLQMPEGTIKVRLYRSRMRLRHFMERSHEAAYGHH